MVGDKDVWNTITTSVVDACIRLHGHVNWLTAAPSINKHCSPEYSRCCTARHTPVTTGRLKMHDLKMTDKENYGSGKCRSTSLVEFNLPKQCTSKKLYAIHFKVAQA